MQIITQLADRLTGINFGVELAEGKPEDVISNPKL